MHKDFAVYGRMLFEQGLNNSHSGNMSVRQGSSIHITRHGAQLGRLTPRDIVRTNLRNDGRDKDASFEVKVHRAVYLADPSVGAVAHAHTAYGTVLSFFKDAITPIDAEGQHYLPGIPVLSCRSTIASDEVACRLPELLSRGRAAIVRGHGAFAAGKTLEEAALYLSVLESVCRIVYLTESYQMSAFSPQLTTKRK